MFALNRIDDQVLTREVVVGALRRVQGAFKSLPQHGRLSIRRADRASTYRARSIIPSFSPTIQHGRGQSLERLVARRGKPFCAQLAALMN